MFTALHAAIGLEPALDLRFEHVEQAVAERVREVARLEWKRTLPLISDPSADKNKQREELAKDLAAMANSGGGTIVYGVAEDKVDGISVAHEVRPTGVVTEEIEQRIRQVASSGISPPLTGLTLLNLTPPGDATGGVLVIDIPDSPDRPHLVPRTTGDQFWFVASRRNGPHTEAMTEHELATAYRQREQSRRSAERDLQDLFEQVADSTGADDSPDPVIIAVARPTTLLRSSRLTYDQAQQLLATSSAHSRLPSAPLTLTHGEAMSRGLRSHYKTVTGKLAARAQVFDDGSVGVALRRSREGNYLPGTGVVISDIEGVALDLFLLMWRAVEVLGVPGDYQAQLNIYPPTSLFFDEVIEHGAQLPRFALAARRPGYRAVDGVIMSSSGRADAAESSREFIVDAMEQAGGHCTLTTENILTICRTPSVAGTVTSSFR